MVPIHASFGLVTFMLACAACLTGLTQKAIWKLGYVHLHHKNNHGNCKYLLILEISFSTAYADWTEEGIVINAIGATIIALGIVVSFAVRRSNAPATAKVYVTERL